MNRPLSDISPEAFATPLLAWYDLHGRDLPWRKRWPELADPYHVFLSELMLQQTVVATVIPYFEEFRMRWPTIHALASASEEAVMQKWAGLGYYARARNMHKAAKVISQDYKGQFPRMERACLLCQALALTQQQRFKPSPLIKMPLFWMAMLNVFWHAI